MSDFFSGLNVPDVSDSILTEEQRKQKAAADFLRRLSPPTKAAVSTDESYRAADKEKLNGGLESIVEGGLLAATNRPVPAELAAAAGQQGQRIDLREQTDLDVPDQPGKTGIVPGFFRKSSVVGEGVQRFTEGVRRGLDSIEERRGQFFGVGPELRAMAPQRAIEDTRIIAPADSAAEHVIDFAGEVAPEVVTSIATGGVTGANRAVAQAVEGAGGSAFRNWAARRAADVALGTAENFASAAVPVEAIPKVAAGTLAFSAALSTIPGGAKLASHLFGGDNVSTPLTRTLAEMVEEGSEAGIARSYDDALAESLQRAQVPPSFPGNVRVTKPATTLVEAFSGGSSAKVDLAGAQRTAIEDLSSIAETKLIPFELLPNRRFRVDGIEAASIREAAELIDSPRRRHSFHLADSIRAYLGDETDEVVSRVDQKLSTLDPIADKDYRLAVTAAASQSPEHAANIVRAVDSLDEAEMMSMLSLKSVRKAAAGATEATQLGLFGTAASRAQKNSNIFKEIYINGALQNLGTHAVNIVSNTAQLPLRTAVVGAEGLFGDASRAMRSIGFSVDDTVASKSVTDVIPLLHGYARGAKTYLDVLSEVGRNLRENGESYRLTDIERSAIRNNLNVDNESFVSHGFNTLRALWSLTDDGGGSIAKELDNKMSQAFGGDVTLGGIAKDAAIGAQGATPTRLGGFVRAPTNALQAADSFFKSVNFTGERNAIMRRKAAVMGQKASDWINGAVAPELKAAWRKDMQEASKTASELAQINTFTNELGRLGTALKNVRDAAELPLHPGDGYKIGNKIYRPSIPAGVVYQPFLQTPINIVKNFSMHTPLGLLIGSGRFAASGMNEKVVMELSQGVVGTGIMIGAYSLIANGKLDVRSAEADSATRRTAETASGGQFISADLVLEDGTRVPLNRFGVSGLLVAAAADINRKVFQQAEKSLIEGEALFSRGAISEERLMEIREKATADTISEIIRSREGAVLGLESGFSAFANNVWNETSIADAIELLISIGEVSEDPSKTKQLIQGLEAKFAQAVQPSALLNSLAKAEQEGKIQVPTDEAGLGSRLFTRVAQRLPFVEPSPGESRGLVDIAGNERHSRFPGDQSENLGTRFLGATLGAMGPLVGLRNPELVEDETRNNGTKMAQAMQSVGATKNFPYVSSDLKKELAIPSQVEEQIQMLKGQMRVSIGLPLVESEEWKQLAQEEPDVARQVLEKELAKADNASNDIVRGALMEQAARQEELDLSRDEALAEFDLPSIILIREKENTDFLRRRLE